MFLHINWMNLNHIGHAHIMAVLLLTLLHWFKGAYALIYMSFVCDKRRIY